MKVAAWIDHLEKIKEHPILIDRNADKLSECNTICKVITPNVPTMRERDYLFKEGNKAKTLKAVNSILKTIGKAHRNDKVGEKSSGNKKPKKSVHNPADVNNGRLSRHNHLWKNCPKISNTKYYNETHYSKVRD